MKLAVCLACSIVIFVSINVTKLFAVQQEVQQQQPLYAEVQPSAQYSTNSEQNTIVIPEYDIAGYCKRLGQGMEGSSIIEKRCIEMEKNAKKSISSMKGITSEIMAKSVRQTASFGNSYVQLRRYLEQSLYK